MIARSSPSLFNSRMIGAPSAEPEAAREPAVLVLQRDGRGALLRERVHEPELAVLVPEREGGRPSVPRPNFARTLPLRSTIAMLADPSENRPNVARTLPSSATASPAEPSDWTPNRARSFSSGP